MLLQFSASLEAASDVDFMRTKDIFSFSGNSEPGIPCDGLDMNLPSYHKVGKYKKIKYKIENEVP